MTAQKQETLVGNFENSLLRDQIREIAVKFEFAKIYKRLARFYCDLYRSKRRFWVPGQFEAMEPIVSDDKTPSILGLRVTLVNGVTLDLEDDGDPIEKLCKIDVGSLKLFWEAGLQFEGYVRLLNRFSILHSQVDLTHKYWLSTFWLLNKKQRAYGRPNVLPTLPTSGGDLFFDLPDRLADLAKYFLGAIESCLVPEMLVSGWWDKSQSCFNYQTDYSEQVCSIIWHSTGIDFRISEKLKLSIDLLGKIKFCDLAPEEIFVMSLLSSEIRELLRTQAAGNAA